VNFRTVEPALKEVLNLTAKGEKGETRLPDSQRGWVWGDSHIRSLIASISLSYLIGAVMFLKAGGVPLAPRQFEEVAIHPPPDVMTFVPDGQQRLTFLCLALYGENPVKIKIKMISLFSRVGASE
jgi:uncharacterized protein with ParB-like and HNH nuclease domain